MNISDKPYPSVENRFDNDHAELIAGSFENLLGRSLLPDCFEYKYVGERLFFAPFAVVSHGIENDPVFNYANRTALELFEFSWNEFILLPSRLSAEPVNRDERTGLLREVAAKGFIDHYQGIRISKNGKRFKIINAVIWNLMDEQNIYRGQAAFFDQWQFLD